MPKKKSSAMVAARIRELRIAAGLTQEQLAERMGGATPSSTISRYERGVFLPTYDSIDRICKALRITPTTFFAGMGTQAPPRPEVRRINELLKPLSSEQLKIVRKLLRAHLAGVKAG